MCHPFNIKINDEIHHFEPPPSLIKKSEIDSAEAQSKKDLEDIRQLVSKLYLHLNIEQYEIEKEEQILKDLELLRLELEPLEKVGLQINSTRKTKTKEKIVYLKKKEKKRARSQS